MHAARRVGWVDPIVQYLQNVHNIGLSGPIGTPPALMCRSPFFFSHRGGRPRAVGPLHVFLQAWGGLEGNLIPSTEQVRAGVVRLVPEDDEAEEAHYFHLQQCHHAITGCCYSVAAGRLCCCRPGSCGCMIAVARRHLRCTKQWWCSSQSVWERSTR